MAHFQVKDFALRLALKKRLKTTRKWLVGLYHCQFESPLSHTVLKCVKQGP